MRGNFWFGAATAALLIAGAGPTSAQEADQPGDSSSSTRFAVGQSVEGDISQAGDVDWFRMRAEVGQRYSITLEGLANEAGEALDPMLAIYDLSGAQLAFNDDADGFNSALQFTPTVTGDVFIEARAFSGEATGRYRMNAAAQALPHDAVGNDTSTRARISSGRTVAGALEYEGDVDAYRLDVRTNQRYRVALNAADGASEPLGDPFLRVVDREGNELAVNDDIEGSLNSAVEFIPRTSGPVFVEARSFGDAYTGAYELSVVAERLPNDPASGDRSTRGRIAPGQSVSASLDFPADTDWYRIRLNGGESYRFGLAGGIIGPVGDPLVKIYDAEGAELAMDDDGGDGFDAYLEFTAPSSGYYFVEARGFGEDATGSYVLSARAGDIPGDNSTDVGLSGEGDYREGALAIPGDRDWFRIELAEGQSLRIGLVSIGADPLEDPYLVLYGPDGAELVRDDDGGEGLNAFLEYQATASGPHYVEARGFTEDAQGGYAISITGGEIGASAETADTLAPNGEGRVSLIGAPEDVDWFSIELIEGRPYRFNLMSAEPSGLADPYLVLYNSEGAEVASNDDGGTGLNAYLNFASPTGGPYFVAVSSFGGAGGGQYVLTVSDTDVPGSVNTDETLDALDDARVSRIEMPGDIDSYRVMLEAGSRYVIDARGHGDNPLADPYLALIDPQGERIDDDDDSGDGLDARLRFTPTESGEYYLQASGLSLSTGDYEIKIVRQ